jgi:drug/metabolite transporter (DMT)-like permease
MVPLLALAAAVFYGAADFIGGIATRRATTLAVVVLSQAAGLIVLALALPILPAAEPSRADLGWGVAAGIAGGVGVALLYRALAIGVMAVVAPTTAVCAVTIPVVIAVATGERPAPLAAAGIALGVLSIVLVSQAPPHDPHAHVHTLEPTEPPPPSRSHRNGVGEALAAGVGVGLFFWLLAQTQAASGTWPLLASRCATVSLFTVAAIAGGHSLRMPMSVTTLAVLCGAIDMFANVLYVVAARQGPLSIAVTLSSLYPASTVLLARALVGERLGWLQVLGVTCAVVAVLLIVNG